jgi:hypothetical protein
MFAGVFLWTGVVEKPFLKPADHGEQQLLGRRQRWVAGRHGRHGACARLFRAKLNEEPNQKREVPSQSPFSGIATSDSVQDKSKYAEMLLQSNEKLRQWSERNLQQVPDETKADDNAASSASEEHSTLQDEKRAKPPSTARPSGSRPRRYTKPPRPVGYWTEENLKREVFDFIKTRPGPQEDPPLMPTSSELRKANRGDLVQAIIRYGGYVKLAKRCGLRTHRREFHFWQKDFGNLEREIWKFIRERDGPDAIPPQTSEQASLQTNQMSSKNATEAMPRPRPRMPTYAELLAAKKRILGYAINTYGGFEAVAKRMNLETSNDATPWRDRDALVAELNRLFPDLMGKQKRFPRQQDLVRLGRHDLDWAIHRWHGGYVQLASSLGYLRARLHCRPRHFWTEEKNLENELRALLKAKNLGWRMPSYDELVALDRHDLLYAIKKFGGFFAVASKLGLSRESHTRNRPRGYWSDFENLRNELETFVQENGYPGIMPRFDQLRMYNREDLIYAIHQHGGPAEVARRLHLFWYGPNTFWRNFENVRQRLRVFLQKSRFSSGHMPTQQELISAGRLDLVYGVHLHGGVYEVARRLRLEVKDPPRAPFYWNAIENVETELNAFINSAVLASWIQSGVMPTSMTVVRSGRRDLAAAIRRHGGWDAIARRLNLRPASPKRPKGYWNTFRNVEAELLLYVQQREQVIVEYLRNYAPTLIHASSSQEEAAPQPSNEDADAAAKNATNRRYRSIADAIRHRERVPSMPTADELRLDGRADLVFACERIHGGMETVAERIGWPSLGKRLSPDSLKRDIQALTQELMTMWIPIYGSAEEMPQEADVLRTGRQDIHEAILHHDGYVAVARALGLRHPEDPQWKDWFEKRFVKQRKPTRTSRSESKTTNESSGSE